MGEENPFPNEIWERLDSLPFVEGARRLRGFSASQDAWYEVVEYEEMEEAAPCCSSPEATFARKKLPYVPEDIVWE